MQVKWLPALLALAAACSTDNTGNGVVLQAPSSLSSVSLDRAVALMWSDNPYLEDPDHFQHYRIYSTSYDLDNDLCGSNWRLEGTTVAPEFRVGAMTNGVPRCFTVTAVSVDGIESDLSPRRSDTPRPDARNVALFTRQSSNAESGFRFWSDLNNDGRAQDNELGLVGSGSSTSIDFSVERDVNGAIFLHPVRAGTGVELYGNGPVEDLVDIDFAEAGTYRTTDIEAAPGFGYVFEMSGGDGFARYGALRVTHVGTNMIIFDWAFQTDPGNPELRVGGIARK